MCVCTVNVLAPFEILRLSLVKQDSGGAFEAVTGWYYLRKISQRREVYFIYFFGGASWTFVTCDEGTLVCHGIRAH